MKITEQFIMSKAGRPETCEDIIFTGAGFIAVIDGATSRGGAKYGGKTSGRAAAETVEEALASLDANAALSDILETVTEAFKAFYSKHGIDINDHSKRLTASAAVYSRAHRLVWLIGDCQTMINGKLYGNPNGIDENVASVRAMINQSELIKGKTKAWVAENDPGAEFIRPLLTTQFHYQNLSAARAGGFAYCAFDGMDIDPAQVKEVPVPPGAEIILASDGYPVLRPTLAESEKELEVLLARDPLCIYENKCVKGVKPGNVSFDDRSFVRFTD